MSAILLMHSLLTQEELARNQGWLFGTLPNVIMPACHAIAVHSFNPQDIKINFRQYPYAFLLMLCDELQDWGRSVGGKDYTELTDFEFCYQRDTPTINCTLRIHNDTKLNDLDKLKSKLNTDGLMKISIKRKNGGRTWKI